MLSCVASAAPRVSKPAFAFDPDPGRDVGRIDPAWTPRLAREESTGGEEGRRRVSPLMVGEPGMRRGSCLSSGREGTRRWLAVSSVRGRCCVQGWVGGCCAWGIEC
eukprot:6205949-Pleurochrysis_carterae.AAC.2